MTSRKISIAFQTNKTASDYVHLAKLVNQYPFDLVSVYCDAPFHPSYGPLLLMAPYIERARLGPAAVSPFRIHPIDIAANTALLAGIAQGGVYIGLARGAWLEEHSIREPKYPITGIREAAIIVRKLLSGQKAGYDGKVFQIKDHVIAPYPLPNETIPLLIGTWGKKMAVTSGEIADEVKIGGSANPKMVQYLRKFIHEGEKHSGRPSGEVELVIGAVTVVDQDRELARQIARMEVSLYLPVVASLDPTFEIEPELIERIQHKFRESDRRGTAELISDEILDRFAFSGNVNDILYQCNELFSAGADRIEFGTPHGQIQAEGIRLLGENVVPNLVNHR